MAIANISGEMEIIANRTAEALFGIQKEIDSLKRIVLQNRRALDLLTAQAGRVCTMLNESCCSFIDQSGKVLRDVNEIWKHAKILHMVYQDGKASWLEDLLNGWGLKGWLVSLAKGGLMMLIVILTILILLPCLFHCIQRMVTSAMKRVWIAQRKEGGFVEDYLEQNGHMSDPGLMSIARD